MHRKLYRFWVLDVTDKNMNILTNCRSCQKSYSFTFDSSMTMADIIRTVDKRPTCPKCKKGESKDARP